MDDVQNLPIDIHVGKLVDWLVSRQHASKDWVKNTRDVREKINAAIQDMPEHPEILKLLSGSYINYFHCLKIVDILRETEADSMNILGWYTSQRMKDWQAIVKQYEKGGTGLAECSQLLHRYVAYEIPSVNSQIERCYQIQQECDKKEVDAHKSATNALNLYLKQCKQIGIQGNDVHEEILGLLSKLPSELNKIGSTFSNLTDAFQFYLDFISFTSDGCYQDSLSMLKYIIDHGNVSTYEYIHKEAPLHLEDPIATLLGAQKLEKSEIDNKDTKQMDSGDLNVGGGIDFGDDAVEEIDFGDDGIIDFGDNEDKIDWDVTDENLAGISIEGSGMEGGIARGSEALSLLLNSSIRVTILDDLCELEGFLEQRALEINASAQSNMVLNVFDGAPKSLQMVSFEQVTDQLQQVQSITELLLSSKMSQLFLISESPRYVDRLSNNLNKQQEKSIVSPSLLTGIADRRKQAAEEQIKLHKQLQKLKEASKSLCNEVQDIISTKYHGRPVNIMGVLKSL